MAATAAPPARVGDEAEHAAVDERSLEEGSVLTVHEGGGPSEVPSGSVYLAIAVALAAFWTVAGYLIWSLFA